MRLRVIGKKRSGSMWCLAPLDHDVETKALLVCVVTFNARTTLVLICIISRHVHDVVTALVLACY